jgi:hypothetical protein
MSLADCFMISVYKLGTTHHKVLNFPMAPMFVAAHGDNAIFLCAKRSSEFDFTSLDRAKKESRAWTSCRNYPFCIGADREYLHGLAGVANGSNIITDISICLANRA